MAKAKPRRASEPYFSEPFARGLRVLGLFGPGQKDLSLSEIAAALDSQPGSIYRFTNTLVELGFLRKEPRTKRLSLGQRAYNLGLSLVNSFSLLDVVKPFIDEVHDRFNISIDSCVLEEQALLQLYYSAAKDAPSYKALIINPAIHCTGLGKAIMAYLPDKELKALLRRLPLVQRTDRSLTTKHELLADLEETRKRGYAINNEEYVKGLFTIATPFFDIGKRRPIGAVSFDFLVSQASLKEVEETYADVLLKLGKDISAAII